MSAIVEFLEGAGRDGAGRMIDEVLGFGFEDLEGRHDFIQWLFPLMEPSAAVPGSPVIAADDIARVRASVRAQGNLRAAAERMGAFYDRTDRWLRPQDHNHLRITRIIRSLRLLVGDAAADRFRHRILARVEAAQAPVSATSQGYWTQA